MSSSLKPIIVHGGPPHPNPARVHLILRELGVPFEKASTDISEVKGPAFLALNPNGRLPAIEDPNTGITLWESGAIVQYLVSKYDKDHKISFPEGSTEALLAQQWLFFQATGQGPYYGQRIFFDLYHPEKLPSVLERFSKEINRVTGVLEDVLARTETKGDGPWLVGDKLSYADLAWVPWQMIVGNLVPKEEYDQDKYPHVKRWLAKMTGREAAQATFAQGDGH